MFKLSVKLGWDYSSTLTSIKQEGKDPLDFRALECFNGQR